MSHVQKIAAMALKMIDMRRDLDEAKMLINDVLALSASKGPEFERLRAFVRRLEDKADQKG